MAVAPDAWAASELSDSDWEDKPESQDVGWPGAEPKGPRVKAEPAVKAELAEPRRPPAPSTSSSRSSSSSSRSSSRSQASRSRSRSLEREAMLAELPQVVQPRRGPRRGRGKITGAETVGPWPTTSAALEALAQAQRANVLRDLKLVADQANQRRYKANVVAQRRECTITVHLGTRNMHLQNVPTLVRDWFHDRRASATGALAGRR